MLIFPRHIGDNIVIQDRNNVDRIGEWHNVWKYSGHHLIDTVEHENIQCVGYKRGYSLMWCVRLQYLIFFSNFGWVGLTLSPGYKSGRDILSVPTSILGLNISYLKSEQPVALVCTI